MRAVQCPKCHQPTAMTDEGNCMLCGFNVRYVQRMTLRLYIVVTAVSLATLIYGVIVFAVEQIAPPDVTDPGIIPYVLLIASLVLGAMAVFGVKPMLRKRTGSMVVFRQLLLQAVFAESIAIMGLLLYFIAGSIQWFTIFLGISWLVFTVIGLKLGESIVEYERRLVIELEADSSRLA